MATCKGKSKLSVKQYYNLAASLENTNNFTN